MITLYMLTSTALSPVETGNFLAFIFIGNLLAKPVAVKLLNRHIAGPLYFSLSALFTFATYLPFLFIGLYTQPILLIAACLTHGIARSFQFLGYSSAVLWDVAQKDFAPANVFIGSVMQVNLLVGQTLPALFVVLVAAAGLSNHHHSAFLLLGVGSIALMAFCAFIGTACRQR